MDPSITKRTSDRNVVNLTPHRGMAHSMHRKDGEEGKGGKDGKVHYANLAEKPGDRFPHEEKGPSYPSMHLHSSKLPELANHKIGDEMHMSVKAKVRGVRADKSGHHVDLDVTHAAIHKGGK